MYMTCLIKGFELADIILKDLQLWVIKIRQSDDNEGKIIYGVKPQVAPILLLYFMILFMILLHMI